MSHFAKITDRYSSKEYSENIALAGIWNSFLFSLLGTVLYFLVAMLFSSMGAWGGDSYFFFVHFVVFIIQIAKFVNNPKSNERRNGAFFLVSLIFYPFFSMFVFYIILGILLHSFGGSIF